MRIENWRVRQQTYIWIEGKGGGTVVYQKLSVGNTLYNRSSAIHFMNREIGIWLALSAVQFTLQILCFRSMNVSR